MAMAYCGTRLSPNIIRTSEGFIIATAQICRSGKQRYKRSEIDLTSGDDTTVDVYRPPSEVTSAATIASGEGKPLTLNHPSKFLTPDSWAWSAKGHMQHIRVGTPDPKTGDIPLVADVHIHDQGLIDRIAHGVRDLSCGYNYELVEGDYGPEMRNIRINHLAVVESGRAGNARIVDSVDERTRKALDDVLNWGGGENNETVLPGGEGDTPLSESARESTAIEDDVEDEEISMGKSKDENRDSQIARLCDLLEKFLSKRSASTSESTEDEQPDTLTTDLIPDDLSSEGNINPVVQDARTALDGLRRLRPSILASGDREAALDYNDAVRRLKRTIATGRACPSEPLTRSTAYDTTKSGRFEEACARRHRQPVKAHGEVQVDDTERSARDRQPTVASYQEMVDRVRRKSLSEAK
jgi:hypothetical protein